MLVRTELFVYMAYMCNVQRYISLVLLWRVIKIHIFADPVLWSSYQPAYSLLCIELYVILRSIGSGSEGFEKAKQAFLLLFHTAPPYTRGVYFRMFLARSPT